MSLLRQGLEPLGFTRNAKMWANKVKSVYIHSIIHDFDLVFFIFCRSLVALKL